MEEKENFSGDEIMKMATAIYNKHFAVCSRIKEDLISEGVLAILSAIERYDKGQGVKVTTYAWNWARGKMMELLKKEIRSEQKLGCLADCDWVQDDSLDFKESLYMKDEIDKVMKSVALFSEKDKFIVKKIMEGYNRAEIARLLNTSPQSIWMMWDRIKSKIREGVRR